MITPSQCRAARGLLDWTRQELADAARIGVATIRLFEGDAAESRHAPLVQCSNGAFELAGVEFIDEKGGGPRSTPPQTPTGKVRQAIDSGLANKYRCTLRSGCALYPERSRWQPAVMTRA